MNVIKIALITLIAYSPVYLDARTQETTPSPAPVSADTYKIDAIKVIIYGDEETVIITESEVNRPSIDGQMRSLEDLIFENLIYLDAKRMGATPTPEDIQRHWEEVKRSNNLSEDDMKNIASQSGYTIAEAKAQLGKMSAMNQMMDFKVRSGLFVPKREVEKYYNEHPEVESAEYYIARVVVPYSDLESKEQQQKRLERYARTGKGDMRLAWSEPFWIMHDDVAPEKQFIYTMKVGQTSQPQPTVGGFELFRLVDKKPERLVPLEERYTTIENQLKMPKYQELLEKYKKEIYDGATMVYY